MSIDQIARGLALGAPKVAQDAAIAKRSRAFQRFWYMLGGRATTPVDIVTFGDSITEGYPPSGVAANLLTNQAWRKLLIDKLRVRFPTTSAAGTPGYYATQHVVNPSDYPVVNSGGVVASTYGLALRNLHLNSAGDFCTFTCPANTTEVDIFWVRYPSTTTFDWSVNGGGTTNVNTVGTTEDFHSTRVTGLTAGDVVKVAYVSGAGIFIDGFFAYGGDTAKGLRIWDAGRASATYAIMNGGSDPNRWLRAFNVIQPALVTIELGCNDATVAGGSRSAAQVAADTVTWIAAMKAQCTTPPSILIMATWQVGDPAEPWANYVAALRAVAAADADCSFLDMRSVIYKPDVSSNTAGGNLPDTTHPGPAASETIAEAVFNTIVPGAPASL